MNNILITGASAGIGEACSVAAAKQGYKVYGGYRKDSDGEKLSTLHKNIVPLKLDVSSDQNIDEAYRKIESEDGKLNCLFNNAGVAFSGTNEFFPIEKFESQIQINLLAPVKLTQKFLPLIRKADDKRILFTGSAAGLLSKPMMGSYAASKFALEGFVDSLRIEVFDQGIKVALFEPGKIKTNIYQKSLEEYEQAVSQMSALEKQLYQKFIDVAGKNIRTADDHSSDVSVVVDVFLHALLSDKPKTRYPVGGDAKQQAFLARFIPDKLRDKIILSKVDKLLKA